MKLVQVHCTKKAGEFLHDICAIDAIKMQIVTLSADAVARKKKKQVICAIDAIKMQIVTF